MYNTTELQKKITELKKEKDFCILAHAYQTQEIIEIADFVGDSYGLSKQAQSAPQKNILMCGVRFMAETAKILSPEKTVYLSHSDAGCPMAEQLTYDELKKYWLTYSGSIDQFVRDAKEGKFGTSENRYSYGRIEALKNMKIVLPREDV